MPQDTADVVICGAGIAGVSAAFNLAVERGLNRVVLVDERPPLSLTSDKSTECYRNWWPGPGDAMVALMNRSIDILEKLAHETDNIFQLNRRGYLFVTANPERIADFERTAKEAAELGAGPVRYHTGQAGEPAYVPPPAHGFEDQPTGADLILDPALIREHFPYLSERAIAAVHARRAGWFSAQQLGMTMLEKARAKGVRLLEARVEGVQVNGGRVQAVHLSSKGGTMTISTPNFVNAAGPFLKQVGRMVGVDLPVFAECHVKVAINDHLGIVPRDAPMIIWSDPQYLPWSEEERAELATSDETRWLLEEFPHGVHARPEGSVESNILLILWTYDMDPVEPTFPITFDPYYPEIVLRGLSTAIPALKAYFERMPRPVLDGGYYLKTQENRPLVGRLPVEGAYILGALSGFGLMAAPASGELLATYLTGGQLPHYAPAFALERYEDPAYQELLQNWGASGQL
ncbi:MAG: FAD-dependent oxidoreductase [Anaerolineae bacterium]